MKDKLLRESLRIERGAIGSAHPFIVTSFTVKTSETVVKSECGVRENPAIERRGYIGIH